MATAGRVAKAAGLTLGYLVAADLVGVVVSFVFDIVPSRRTSSLLPYAVWLVLGVFSGLLSYNAAGAVISGKDDEDWSTRAGSGKAGIAALVLIAGILIFSFFVFYFLMWRGSMEESSFVSDNPSLTITFLVPALLSTVLAHFLFRSAPKR